MTRHFEKSCLIHFWMIVFLLLFTSFSFAEQSAEQNQAASAGTGPSFDCSKAKTEVEKLICGSGSLSKMDLELSEIYSKFSSSLGESEKAALKKEQIEWIKGRSKKIDAGINPDDDPEYIQKKKVGNLLREYDSRIAAIKTQIENQALRKAKAAKKNADSENQTKSESLGSSEHYQYTPPVPVKTEAEKAQRVKTILEKYPMHLDLRLSKDKKFCDEFFEALKRADKSIEYIEPVFKTDNPDDPGLEKYHSCDDAESRPDFTGRGEGLYDSISFIGDLNFKIFRLDMDDNPENGLDEYIYAEVKTDEGGTGTIPGYARIDFIKCEFADAVSIYQNKVPSQKWLLENYNAMIRYKGEIFIYDLSESRDRFDDNNPLYSLSLVKYSKSERYFDQASFGYWHYKPTILK